MNNNNPHVNPGQQWNHHVPSHPLQPHHHSHNHHQATQPHHQHVHLSFQPGGMTSNPHPTWQPQQQQQQRYNYIPTQTIFSTSEEFKELKKSFSALQKRVVILEENNKKNEKEKDSNEVVTNALQERVSILEKENQILKQELNDIQTRTRRKRKIIGDSDSSSDYVVEYCDVDKPVESVYNDIEESNRDRKNRINIASEIERVGTFDDEVEQIIGESETILMNEKSTKQNNNNNYNNKSWSNLTPCKRNYNNNNNEYQSSNTAAARSTYVLSNSSQNINNNLNNENDISSAAFLSPTKKRNYSHTFNEKEEGELESMNASSSSLQEKENEKKDTFFSIETTVTIPPSKHDIHWEKRLEQYLKDPTNSSNAAWARDQSYYFLNYMIQHPQKQKLDEYRAQRLIEMNLFCPSPEEMENGTRRKKSTKKIKTTTLTNIASFSNKNNDTTDTTNTCGNTHEARWNRNFKELKQFYNKYGHSNYKTNQPGLGSWVSKQRKTYKKGNLSQERIDKLLSIEFEFHYEKKQRNLRKTDYFDSNSENNEFFYATTGYTYEDQNAQQEGQQSDDETEMDEEEKQEIYEYNAYLRDQPFESNDDEESRTGVSGVE